MAIKVEHKRMSSEKKVEGNDFQFSLFLQYSELPISQYSNILLSIEGVYRSVYLTFNPLVKRYSTYPAMLALLHFRSTNFPTMPELFVDRIETGHSILSHIKVADKWYPYFDKTDKDEIAIFIPKWSAALIFAGLLLKGGLTADIDIKHRELLVLQIEQLEREEKPYKLQNAEIPKEKKSQLSQQRRILEEMESYNLDKLNDNKNPNIDDIHMHLSSFHKQIWQNNITKARLNGDIIKQHEEFETNQKGNI